MIVYWQDTIRTDVFVFPVYSPGDLVRIAECLRTPCQDTSDTVSRGISRLLAKTVKIMPLKIKTYVYCLRLCTGELGSHLDLPPAPGGPRRGRALATGGHDCVPESCLPRPLIVSRVSSVSQMTEHSLL